MELSINYIARQATDCLAESVDNMVECLEHVFESHGTKLLPDLFYGIHLKCVGRYVQQSDVVVSFEPPTICVNLPHHKPA